MNRWLHGPKYPLPETRFEKLYLGSSGRLSFTPPEGKQANDRYVYDPGDPTPMLGCSGESMGGSKPSLRVKIYCHHNCAGA